MRQNKTLKRGRVVPLHVVPIVLAGGIGFLIGNSAALRGTDLSAAAAVALRFPDHWDDPSPAAWPAALAAAMNASAANATSDAQLALLSPQPMVPQTIPQAAPQVVPVQTAALDQPGLSAAPDANPSQPPPALAAQAPSEARAPAAAARHRVVNRPGYMLDDAQIASIKERLNLTPDQEAMWPAVEAALRNMSYTRVQEARTRGVDAAAQTAAVDPEAVQGLKSAAVPLIMSFNAEQKEEVRNIAHVMGLDQLASQF
jgi:hypothetical protein